MDTHEANVEEAGAENPPVSLPDTSLQIGAALLGDGPNQANIKDEDSHKSSSRSKKSAKSASSKNGDDQKTGLDNNISGHNSAKEANRSGENSEKGSRHGSKPNTARESQHNSENGSKHSSRKNSSRHSENEEKHSSAHASKPNTGRNSEAEEKHASNTGSKHSSRQNTGRNSEAEEKHASLHGSRPGSSHSSKHNTQNGSPQSQKPPSEHGSQNNSRPASAHSSKPIPDDISKQHSKLDSESESSSYSEEEEENIANKTAERNLTNEQKPEDNAQLNSIQQIGADLMGSPDNAGTKESQDTHQETPSTMERTLSPSIDAHQEAGQPILQRPPFFGELSKNTNIPNNNALKDDEYYSSSYSYSYSEEDGLELNKDQAYQPTTTLQQTRPKTINDENDGIPPLLKPHIYHAKDSLTYQALRGEQIHGLTQSALTSIVNDLRNYVDIAVDHNLIDEACHIQACIELIRNDHSAEKMQVDKELIDIEKRLEEANAELEERLSLFVIKQNLLFLLAYLIKYINQIIQKKYGFFFS